jgi:hypothetical protein
MATATVEHIYTWNGTGTGANATYTKDIDINTINGVSFSGSNTIYMLETTIVVHGGSAALSAAQLYRRSFAVFKSAADAVSMTLTTVGGSFDNAACDKQAITPAATPINYTNPSTTNIRITFTNNYWSTSAIYYRAICKVIAYKAS